jgi:hypothetical protein
MEDTSKAKDDQILLVLKQIDDKLERLLAETQKQVQKAYRNRD